MNLPSPTANYSPSDQSAVRQAIGQADQQNVKKSDDLDLKGKRLFIYDSNGQRYSVSVSVSGALSATAA